MAWDQPEILKLSRYRGRPPGIRFSEKRNTVLNASLSRLIKGAGNFIDLYFGSGEHEGLISFVIREKKELKSLSLHFNTHNNTATFSIRLLVKQFKLDKEFIEFKKEGDRFVGKLPGKTPGPSSVTKPDKPPQEKAPVKPAETKPAPSVESFQKEKTQIQKKPPTKETPQNDILEKQTTGGKRDLLAIRFGNKPMCRLTKKMGTEAKGYDYIRIEKTPGQGELRVAFLKKPGDGAISIRRQHNGVMFTATQFMKLHSLTDKLIEFEHDPASGFYYGTIL